jgi:EmrB/QacA subfamily drug resistance transporter
MLSGIEKKWKIFFLVGTSIFMSTLDSSIVNVALPFMLQDLKSDIQVIQWVVLIYLLTVSSLLLTFGRLSDIKGRKPIYVTGFSLFTAGSLLCGMADTPAWLIISRSVQGLGASMLMACSPALIVDVFPPHERGRALGMIGAVVAAGLTTGPVAGGMILQYLSWRYIFYINLPIGIAAAVGGLVLLSGKEDAGGSKEPMDLSGSIILVVFLVSLILVLTQIPSWGVLSFTTLFFFSLSIASGWAFAVNEKKADFPLFDMSLLRIRMFVFPVMASAVLFAALFIIIFMMPFFLAYPCGFSASKTGSVMIVPFLFLLIISPVSGALYDKIGSRKLCLAGMGLVAVSLIILTTLDTVTGAWPVVWRIALAGIGTALFTSPNNTAAMNSVPVQRRGIASGAVATARNVGMVTGVAIAGLVFTSSFAALTQGASLEQYEPAMYLSFMVSFKRTLIAGACIALAGMGVVWARGSEKRT